MLIRWSPAVLLGLWPFLYRMTIDPAEWAEIGLVFIIGFVWIASLLAMAALVERKFPLALRSRVAAFLAVAAALLFCYGFLEATLLHYLNYWLPLRYMFGIWLVLFLGGTVLAYRFGDRPIFMRALAGLAIVLLLIPLATLVRNLLLQSPWTGTGSAGEAAVAHADRPNVYFFVFDAYGRADQLQDALGFDNGPFVRFLERQDFEVHEASNTNYPTTGTSFVSVLSMQYHTEYDRFRQPWPWQLGLWKSAVLKGNGPVVRKFRSMGYKYVHAEGNYLASRCGGIEDRCIRGKSLGLLDNRLVLLLGMTPALRLVRAYYAEAVRFEPIEFDQTIQALPSFPAAPKFVYAHIFMPHDADRYPDCRIRPRMTKGAEASLEGNPGPYLDTIRCVNRQVRTMLPRLLAADPTAVVIFQSDHGFVVNRQKPFGEWTETEINRRYGNLYAIRLPERCRTMAKDSATSVNTFRIVFACLERRPPDLLPDQSYAIWYYQRNPPTLLRTY